MIQSHQKKKYARYKKIKKRKPFFKTRIFWRVVGIVIITFGLTYLFLFSPVFKIKNIRIEGELRYLNINDLNGEAAALIGEADILNFSSNIFLFKRNSAKIHFLNKFPPIEEIKIKRKLPSDIIFTILERRPVANYCSEKGCFLVDKNGYLFARSDEELILLEMDNKQGEIGQVIIEKILWKNTQLIIKRLEEVLFIKSKAINVLPQKIDIKTDQDWLLIFSPQKSIDRQIQELGLILEKQIPPEKKTQIKYIDLRFEKIFYKMK